MENKVKKVLGKQTECAFDSGKHDICSPPEVVSNMKEFVKKETGKDIHDHKIVVNTIKDLLDCKSESCVLKANAFQQFVKGLDLDKILDEHFKPSGPANDFGLLSNFNIDDVLTQFEVAYPERQFLHIPFQMIDFKKTGTHLAYVDMAEQLKKYKTFGVVLNTDYSTGGGIHWFCLFGERYDDKVVLEYFNSSGKDPMPQVQEWLNKTKHHITKNFMPTEVYYPPNIQFQKDDHSCGVYCLAYIWLRLEGVPCVWFRADNFYDKMMHDLRKNLFRLEI